MTLSLRIEMFILDCKSMRFPAPRCLSLDCRSPEDVMSFMFNEQFKF